MRNRGVSQTTPFLVIPRSLLRGGFIGDQSRIARAGAVVARGLQIVEELHDEWCIELLQLKRRWRHLQSLTGELEQELKRIGVAVTGMVTRAALQRRT